MDLLVSWPNATHFLLGNPTVTLEVDGAAAAATMSEGRAGFVVPAGTASPPVATLTVQFDPAFMGSPTTTLRIEQRFQLLPPGVFTPGGGGPQPLDYVVQAFGSAGPVSQLGLHPLLTSIPILDFWRVIVNTRTVEVTTVQPQLLFPLSLMRRPFPTTSVRVLARTDGIRPLHWITATPAACSSFAANDLLCFLTPPQTSPQDSDDAGFYAVPGRFADARCQPLALRVAVFLGGGLHSNTAPPAARDHFATGRPPWVILPRGWEAALAASGKHVSLVMPVPSGGSHNRAATAALSTLLADVHAVLRAVGDVAAPAGLPVNRPRLGIAAHSNGGGALFSAIGASRTAFKEIWLFETNSTQRNLPTLSRTSGAQILFAGFDPGRVSSPLAAARKMASLSGRIRRLPDPALPDHAAPSALAASSSKLTHALEGGGMAVPASKWNPVISVLPGGVTFDERFEVLHQQIVQANDADGADYLTKALKSSIFN